jgi:2-oxoglutarate dehydrogenase E1 component
MSPKSLLRHPKCVSSVDELVKGRFQEVIDDQNVTPDQVKKIVFSSGKIYYELQEEKDKREAHDVALVRLEQLYPFPKAQLEAIVKKYANADTFVWAQEEPENMGGWGFVLRHWRELPLQVVARSASATPASGSSKRSARRQRKVVVGAFEL